MNLYRRPIVTRIIVFTSLAVAANLPSLPALGDDMSRALAEQDASRQQQIVTANDAELVALIRSAKFDAQQINNQDLRGARRLLSEAMENLRGYIDVKNDTGATWRERLSWALLEEQLGSGDPLDLEQLDLIHRRFAEDIDGLESPRFVNVRQAIRRLVLKSRAADTQEFRQQVEHSIETIAALFEADAQLRDPVARETVAQILGWLDDHEQANWLVRGIRQRVSYPNVMLRLSDRFVNEAAATLVDETEPFNQYARNTSIYGNVNVTGNVTARLVPNPDQGHVEVSFDGSAAAWIRASRKRISVDAVANANVTASMELILTAEGVSELPPASSAYVNARFTGASTRFRGCLDRAISRIILRIARRFEGRASTAAAKSTRQQMNQRIAEEAGNAKQDINSQYHRDLRSPLLRRDAFPDFVKFATTRQELSVRALQADRYQLGAPHEPPEFDSPNDVALRLHESALNNFAASMFGGRTMTEREMRDTWRRYSGGTDEAAPTEPSEEVAITFDEARPISLVIDDGILSLTVRGKRFIVGTRSYPPMNLTIRYSIEQMGEKVRAEMVGEPEIVPPRFTAEGPNRYSARELALRRILGNRLQRDLKKEIVQTKLELSRPIGNLKELLFEHVSADDGWFAVSLCISRPEAGNPEPSIANALAAVDTADSAN